MITTHLQSNVDCQLLTLAMGEKKKKTLMQLHYLPQQLPTRRHQLRLKFSQEERSDAFCRTLIHTRKLDQQRWQVLIAGASGDDLR